MKRNFIIAASIALVFSGCTSSIDHLIEPEVSAKPTQPAQPTSTQYDFEEPNAQKKEAYEKKMRKVASGIKDDPNYQRLELDTPEKKEWFKKLTYRLWDRQITRYQFVSDGLKRYPDHGYEFNFIVRGMTFN